MRKQWLALLVVMTGCPDIPKDNNDGAVPFVEFDPGNAIIPFPNNLVLDPSTGKVNLPQQNCETPAQTQVRTQVLNKLDGFGTFEVGIQATLSEPADMTTLSSGVFLYKRATGTTPVDASSAQPVPIVANVTTTERFDNPNDCQNPAQIAAITIVPLVPLDPRSTYTVAVLDDVKTATGADFHASFVWALIRQSADPVTLSDNCDPTTLANCVVLSNRTPIPEPASTDPTDPNLAQLVGVDTLWKAHAQALAFLDGVGKTTDNRGNVLLAWDFNTQTTTAPLDPLVAGSPAALLGGSPFLQTISIPDLKGAPCDDNGGNPQGCTAFLTAAGIPCTLYPCAKVGDIFLGILPTGSSMYQQPVPNAFDPAHPIPGPWTDPVMPMGQGGWQKTDIFNPAVPAGTIEAIAFIPQAGTFPPPWPTVIFGHGLGSSKESLFAIGSQLAAAGFASVAIDFQAHGSRAVPISNDVNLGCAGVCFNAGGPVTPTEPCDTKTACTGTGEVCMGGAGEVAPTNVPQCYAPFLSPDLATTRDNIRQTVLDLQRLALAAKGCGTTGCTAQSNGRSFAVDGNNIVYMGISLGGIIGTTTSSVEQNFKAAVLNVPGVGLFDILENTQNLTIRCGLVNALIDAGVVMGTKYPASDAACLTDAWKMQPGYIQFSSIGRWVIDPADGANFVTPHPDFAGLVSKRFMIQEVINDQVVPNIAGNDEGMLVGLMAQAASANTGASTPPPPSMAIAQNPVTNLWIQYKDLPPDVGMGFVGNSYQHASLLLPAAGYCSITNTTACSRDTDCPAAEMCVQIGVLGTLQMQTDAITFLFANK